MNYDNDGNLITRVTMRPMTRHSPNRGPVEATVGMRDDGGLCMLSFGDKQISLTPTLSHEFFRTMAVGALSPHVVQSEDFGFRWETLRLMRRTKRFVISVPGEEDRVFADGVAGNFGHSLSLILCVVSEGRLSRPVLKQHQCQVIPLFTSV